MAKAADKKRWDDLHAAYAKVDEAVFKYESELRAKYGPNFQLSWLNTGQRKKLDALREKKRAIGEKIFDLLVRVSPRGDAWLHGVPSWWVYEKLTWEDAIRPKNEPLSVVTPGGHGFPEGSMREAPSKIAVGGQYRTRWRVPPIPAASLVTVREIRASKGKRSKDKFGRWETYGKSVRVLVEWQGGEYWLDEDVLDTDNDGHMKERHVKMPRGTHTDADHFHELLEKGVILKKDRVEGDTIDLNDDEPVRIGIVVNVTGFGPHVGAMYVMQRGSPDGALQEAFEILEQWELDHNQEHFQELEQEYGDDAMQVFTETFDGWAFKLSPHEFADAVAGTDAEQFVDIEPEEEEEEDEEPDEATLPTAENILRDLGPYLEHDGHDAEKQSNVIARLIAKARNHESVDDALDNINELLDAHGIEAIRGDYHVDNYYSDIVALYVNMGDTYAATILYETENGQFLVTSWGDWVEQNERKYKID